MAYALLFINGDLTAVFNILIAASAVSASVCPTSTVTNADAQDAQA